MIPTLKTHRRNALESKPAPSVVLPQPYKLLNPPPGTFGVSSAQGYYGAPLDNSKQSLSIRAHEYGHLAIHKFAPSLDGLDKEVSQDWYQIGLDNVVNGFCAARGVDVSGLPIAARCPPDTARLTRALHALQTLSFKKRKSFQGLSATDVELLQKASKKLRNMGSEARQCGCSKSTFLAVIRKLEDHFGHEPIDSGRTDLVKLIAHGEKAGECSDDKPEWCKCSLEIRILDKSIHRKYLARKRKAGFYGAFRNPLRTLIPAFDGMAWCLKQKRQGGTILLDQSGSMDLDESQIIKLLEDAPQATIAAYSSGKDDCGTIRIYAQGGKYASNTSAPSMGGNGVDGPALDWLAKQSKPLVWICDGVVTGVGDEDHPLLSLECAHKCQEYGILRVDSIGRYFDLAGIRSSP